MTHHQVFAYLAGVSLMTYGIAREAIGEFSGRLMGVSFLAEQAPDAMGGTSGLYLLAGMTTSICTAIVAIWNNRRATSYEALKVEFLEKQAGEREANERIVRETKEEAARMVREAKEEADARYNDLQRQVYEARLASAVKEAKLEALGQGQDRIRTAVNTVAQSTGIPIDPIPRMKNGGSGVLEVLDRIDAATPVLAAPETN